MYKIVRLSVPFPASVMRVAGVTATFFVSVLLE